jgi:hypothetical protein
VLRKLVDDAAGMPQGSVHRIVLEPLDAAATAMLARSLCPEVADDEHALGEVVRESGGSPFLVTQIARLRSPECGGVIGVERRRCHRLSRPSPAGVRSPHPRDRVGGRGAQRAQSGARGRQVSPSAIGSA